MSRGGETNRLGVDDRSVSPVIATILMVAVVVVIAASIGAVAFGFTDNLGEATVAASSDQCVVETVEFDPNDVSGFADQLGSSCVVWFDATQTDYSDGDTVDEWEDQSENPYDLTSADEASISDPTWRNDVDGLAAVEFDGTNDEGLSTSVNTSRANVVGETSISVTALVHVKAGESTILQVGQPVSGDNEYFRHGYNDDGSTDYPWYAFADIDAPPASQFYGHSPNAGTSVDTWKVVSYVHDGDRLDAYVDGESKGGQDGRLDISDGSIQIGYETNDVGPVSSTFLNGAVAELVIFEKALTDDERKAIECALDQKHGNAVSVAGC
jgi:flagellin-like protein